MKSCVSDVMTTRVVAVRKTASFKEMILRMRKFRVSAFPVVDDAGRVIGVVSQADMLNKEADLAAGPGRSRACCASVTTRRRPVSPRPN